jgi:hypothetical protein
LESSLLLVALLGWLVGYRERRKVETPQPDNEIVKESNGNRSILYHTF